MTTIIVSRHESAIRWLKARYPDADVFPELPPVDSLSLGDLVVGNLPLFLVHELNQKGIEVGIISMKVPLELRGKDLSDEVFLECNPEVTSYVVVKTTLDKYGEMLTKMSGRDVDPTKFV